MSENIPYGTTYQIYPRSFQDTNGDGIGDLPGITSRLDYIESLGVDSIWISPVHPSGGHDGGYDITSYMDIDPDYGTLTDYRELVDRAHGLGLGVILDFVPNHTSDQHPWFQASLRSEAPYDEYYTWRPEPPNNWQAHFPNWYTDEQGLMHSLPRSAWTYNKQRGNYYLSSFSPEQPDVNWHNPRVRKEFAKIMRFWMLEVGVDGFRADVIDHIGKDPGERDEAENPEYDGTKGWPRDALMSERSCNDRTAITYLGELAEVLKECEAQDGRPRTLVAEAHVRADQYIPYWVDSRVMPFNFQNVYKRDWNARGYKERNDLYARLVPDFGTPTQVLGNHDEPRLVNRIMEAAGISLAEAHLAARSLITTQMILRGRAYTYMGEELGATNAFVPPHQDPDKYLHRGPQRATMPWNSSRNGGFTTASRGWLPPVPHTRENTAEAQQGDPNSMLNYYRRLQQLRRTIPALGKAGRHVPLETYSHDGMPHPDILSFGRTDDKTSNVITLMNFASEATETRVGRRLDDSIILSSTGENPPFVHPNSPDTIRLEPFQAVVLQTE